jgi:hypothetical protein
MFARSFLAEIDHISCVGGEHGDCPHAHSQQKNKSFKSRFKIDRAALPMPKTIKP